MAGGFGGLIDWLNADLDTGPTDCVLTRLRDRIPPSTPDLHKRYLGFAEKFKFKAQELHSLLGEYGQLNPALRRQLVTQTVSQWIFTTNKIESAGLATEDETMNFLQSSMVPNSNAEREVLYTFNLLQETYDRSINFSQDVFNVDKICSWHNILSVGNSSGTAVLPNPGVLRKFGVSAHPIIELNEPKHIYPHHRTVPFLLFSLCTMLNHLGKLLERDAYQDYRQVLYTFAFAAFGQFHFVDIHPFQDGNGRMCRFISKLTLDGICPVPFPMFAPSVKVEYFHSLVNGRRTNPEDAPSQLLGLLLDSAIKSYSEIIKQHTTLPYSIFFCGTEWQHIAQQLEESHCKLSTSSEEILKAAFSLLEPDTHADVEFLGLMVRVKKMALDEFISLENL